MRITACSIIKRSAIVLLISFLTAASAASAWGQDDKPGDVIRVDTDLIQTDVTVMDKDGHFVEGLKPEQFVLKVDGKPTKIEFFEPVVNLRSVSSSAENKAANGEQKTGANTGGALSVSLRERRVVFFVDDFHISLDSLNRTRLAITHFIDYDMMPQDQVIIVAASGSLGFLQQFTNNKTVLRAALAKLRVMPNTYRDTDQPPMPEYVAVRILNNDNQASSLYINKIIESFNSKMPVGHTAVPNTLSVAAATDMVKQRASGIVTGMAASTKNSLSSLENLLLSISKLKGRKLVFYISDGFYLETKEVPYNTNDALHRSINLATRSGASIYTIDGRGLFSYASSDATGERPFDPNGALDKGRLGEEAASQDGMATLSNLTGGRFLKNQNYFDKWIDRVVDENTSYYLLAWTPDKDELQVKKFRTIEVEVAGRPDLKVRQQRGYLTAWDNPDNKAKNTGAKDTGGKKNIPVLLSLSYLDVPNVGGVLGSSIQVSTGGLSYGEKNDKPAAIDLMGVIFDTQGKQAGTFKTGLTINPNAATDQNVIYSDKKPLAPGVYQVQVAVREEKSGDTGGASQWIEIPDLSKNQLTLGSLFLGGRLVGSAVKTDNTTAQVQFSVDRRFSRPVTLDFMYFVYNAAHTPDGSGGVNLATRVEVLNASGQTIIDTDLRPLTTKGNLDLARIPVRGSIKQQELSPGNYLLRMTVADNIANTKAMQQTVFIVD